MYGEVQNRGEGNSDQEYPGATQSRFETCPTCKGTGYLVDKQPCRHQSEHSLVLKPEYLPKILPAVSRHSSSKSPKRNKLGSLTEFHLKEDNWAQSTHSLNRPLSTLFWSNNAQSKMKRAESETFYSINNASNSILPEKKRIDNIGDYIKLTKLFFKSDDMSVVAKGIENLVQIARQDTVAAWRLMPDAVSKLSDILKVSSKTDITRLACQAIKEIFQSIRYVSRPAFDEIVNSLLNRTADNKHYVRADACEALDVIVSNFPHNYVIRALLSKAPQHKHHTVRITLIQALWKITGMIGAQNILENQQLREIRKPILEAMCMLINDHNYKVRCKAKELILPFVMEPDFFEILHSDVPKRIVRQVESSLNSLKLENASPPGE